MERDRFVGWARMVPLMDGRWVERQAVCPDSRAYGQPYLQTQLSDLVSGRVVGGKTTATSRLLERNLHMHPRAHPFHPPLLRPPR
jgi:hypothetical protein